MNISQTYSSKSLIFRLFALNMKVFPSFSSKR